MTVTTENIETVRATMAANDQRDELVPGCETWAIQYPQPGGDRGQMTRWPNGRGAVAFGAQSDWGDWHGDILTLDTRDNDGDIIQYSEAGAPLD